MVACNEKVSPLPQPSVEVTIDNSTYEASISRVSGTQNNQVNIFLNITVSDDAVLQLNIPIPLSEAGTIGLDELPQDRNPSALFLSNSGTENLDIQELELTIEEIEVNRFIIGQLTILFEDNSIGTSIESSFTVLL